MAETSDLKIVLFYIYSVLCIEMSCQTGINKHVYSFRTKACLPSEVPLFQYSVANIGLCCELCHDTNNCESVSFSERTNECLGYMTCMDNCQQNTTDDNWKIFCEGKNIFFYNYN